jgi:hypothetical protein
MLAITYPMKEKNKGSQTVHTQKKNIKKNNLDKFQKLISTDREISDLDWSRLSRPPSLIFNYAQYPVDIETSEFSKDAGFV